MRRTGRTPIDVNADSRQKTVLEACIPLYTEGIIYFILTCAGNAIHIFIFQIFLRAADNSSRLLISVFSNIFDTCFFTVVSEIIKSSAISRFE